MTHTPGPWEFTPLVCDDDRGMGYIVDSNGREISHHGTSERWKHENLANGYFIAAAPDLLKKLKSMYRAYVNLLELGRDRIIDLGGTCDSLEKMETSDPQLRECRVTIAKVEGKEVV